MHQSSPRVAWSCHQGCAFSLCLLRRGSLRALSLLPGLPSQNEAHADAQTFENLSFLPPRSSGVSFRLLMVSFNQHLLMSFTSKRVTCKPGLQLAVYSGHCDPSPPSSPAHAATPPSSTNSSHALELPGPVPSAWNTISPRERKINELDDSTQPRAGTDRMFFEWCLNK